MCTYKYVNVRVTFIYTYTFSDSQFLYTIQAQCHGEALCVLALFLDGLLALVNCRISNCRTALTNKPTLQTYSSTCFSMPSPCVCACVCVCI